MNITTRNIQNNLTTGNIFLNAGLKEDRSISSLGAFRPHVGPMIIRIIHKPGLPIFGRVATAKTA